MTRDGSTAWQLPAAAARSRVKQAAQGSDGIAKVGVGVAVQVSVSESA